ncbi:CD151 antigen-like [Babylonia areolata]|uniref:CD151 antigen-like n=1 Tax=Babylonia areolata TaxID=304850 RepID=UPI003FD33D1B
MGCGKKLVETLLIVFNVLIFLFGVALVAIGIWSVVDKLYVANVIGDDLFSAASYLLIVGAVVLLALAVLGFCAVRSERQQLVVVYFIALTVIFLVLLITAILAVAFKGELEEEMTDAMRGTLLSSYGDDSTITQSWDRLQRDLECCGVRASTTGLSDGTENFEITRQDSWLIFEQTPWYREARLRKEEPVRLVPESCCVYDEKISNYRDVTKCQTWALGPPGNLRFSVFNNALHYDGCYEKAREFIGDQANILLGCTFAFAFVLVGGLVLAVLLYRQLGEQTRNIRH